MDGIKTTGNTDIYNVLLEFSLSSNHGILAYVVLVLLAFLAVISRRQIHTYLAQLWSFPVGFHLQPSSLAGIPSPSAFSTSQPLRSWSMLEALQFYRNLTSISSTAACVSRALHGYY